MNAREYLEQIEKYDVLIENKRMEKKNWQDIANSITVSMGGEKVQSTPDPHRREAAIVNYLDIEKEIDRCIIQHAIEKQKIIRMLERLPAMEYNVLYKRYVQMQNLQEIADALGKSYARITSWHGRALAHLQNILDETGK